ncbi:hypothetical protein ACFWBC_05745 [Streptomyces sp. NPDC059985]|uniref:hypothetical protein n=1 Tax=Streptomyces sp. NPDC059985 TaxID=3347025 RepID=UPI0036D1E902
MLCTEGPVRTLVDLAPAPEHRRGHGEGQRTTPRRTFNKDLTMVAGLVDSSRAAAADTTTGKEIAPPDKDAFGKELLNLYVALHPVTGQLWY